MGKALDIVVVDDTLMITELFKSYIKMSDTNANVYSFNNSVKALEFINKKKDIDIIITDCKMPFVDGIELLKATSPETTRVMISGYVSEIAEEKLAELNAIFLEKPVPMKEIGKILAEKKANAC